MNSNPEEFLQGVSLRISPVYMTAYKCEINSRNKIQSKIQRIFDILKLLSCLDKVTLYMNLPCQLESKNMPIWPN